jgi:A/G-specific adenine glycosylase
VDGNVLRLISRLTNDDTPVDLPAYKAKVRGELAEVYPEDAGGFTQALMELGATICGPNRKPDCESCPCREFCVGDQMGTAENLPVKLPKRQRREEDRTVFILSCDGKYALEKRGNKGLLAGLWQFPNVLGKLDVDAAVEIPEQWGLRPREILRQLERKHIFTHIQWNMTGYYLEVAEPEGNFQWLTAEEIEQNSALPTAFRQFWEEKENV